MEASERSPLTWVPGPVAPYADWTLVTVDRRGQVARLPAPLRSYGASLRLSPDGRQLIVAANLKWAWNPLMSESALGNVGRHYTCAHRKCSGEGGWSDFVMTPAGVSGLEYDGADKRARLTLMTEGW